MKIVVKASKAVKRRRTIKGSCQSRRKVQASYTEDDISVLMEELERVGTGLAYDITNDDTALVTCVSKSEDAYGETVLVFEVSIGDDGNVVNTIQVGLSSDEDIDQDEIEAWFEEEVRDSF